MEAALNGKKPLFDVDQLVRATDAAKQFGKMSDRAQAQPLFVTGKTGTPKTVLSGYELYERMYARLVELEETINNQVLQARLEEVKKDPVGSSVSWRAVRRTND